MTNTVDIIYCYKNKELSRVKTSLDSLALQDNQSFRVIFVDYGSDEDVAMAVNKLCQGYSFCTYYYVNSKGQMWNRGDALNYGFKLSNAPYVFTSDIDMVYKKNFISYLYSLAKDETMAHFFAVGYLNQKQTDRLNIKHLENSIFTTSKNYALGMMLTSKKIIETINGYNSFYAIWGIEDNDIKKRIENAGYKTAFVNKEVLMLHQYHLPSNEAALPEGWKQYLKDYNEHFYFDTEFNGLKQVIWPKERPTISIIKENKSLSRNITGRRLYIRHCILNDLVNHNSDKILKYNIELSVNDYPYNSTSFKFIKSFNEFLDFINAPFKLISLFKEQYLNKKEVYDEVYFLLKSLEQIIDDYYLDHSENKITLAIVKK